MELTDLHLNAIREAARTVKYGSVTININADSDKLELNIQNRLRFDKAGVLTMGVDVQKNQTVREVMNHRT